MTVLTRGEIDTLGLSEVPRNQRASAAELLKVGPAFVEYRLWTAGHRKGRISSVVTARPARVVESSRRESAEGSYVVTCVEQIVEDES